MSATKPSSLFKLSILSLSLPALFSCMGGTKDIEAKDRHAQIAAAKLTYPWRERLSLTGEYLRATGNGSQTINMSGVQLGGERIESLGQATVLQHSFEMETATMGMHYQLFDKPHFRVNLEAGAQYFAYDLRTQHAGVYLKQKEGNLDGYGKAELEIPFTDQLQLVVDVALSDDVTAHSYFIEFHATENVHLKIGRRNMNHDKTSNAISSGWGDDHNMDGCRDSPASTPCEDSAIQIRAAGLMAGIEFVF